MAEQPVEIDINLRQNVDTEADKAAKGIDRMAGSADEAWKKSQEALNMQRDVVSRLKDELASVEKAFSKVNISTHDPKIFAERQKLSKVVRELTAELKGEEAALGEMMAASDKAAEKSKTLYTQMRLVREAMSELILEGKKETDEYRQKEEELSTLALAYKEVANTQAQLSKGGADMQGILSGLSALSGLLSAGAGAFGLFNSGSEEFAKIQTKVQSLMAITIGLQQIQNTLHQTSAFRIHTVTKANQLWTASLTRLSTALGISTVAAKLLMGTLTLGLSVAIGAAVKLIDNYIAKQRQAAEDQKKLSEATAQNASVQLAAYEKLRASYNKLGDDIKSKEKFILDNRDAFRQLGVSINDVNAADNLFISQTEAFRSAVDQRARAAAAMDMATEKYRSAFQKRMEAEQRQNSPRAFDMGDWVEEDGERFIRWRAAVKLDKEADKLEQEAQDYVTRYIDAENKAAEELKNAGIEAAGKMVKSLDAGSDKSAENAAKKAESAAEKLKKLSVDIQNDIDAAVVAAMEEGTEKKLAELKADYDKRIALIEQKKHEIELLEKETGVDGSSQRGMLDTLAVSETDKYEARAKVVAEASRKVLDQVWRDIDSRFRTQQENRLAEIDLFYAEQSKKARENGATQVELDNISLSHKRDIELEKHQIALETLDFEAQIELKRAEIADERVMLQIDHEEKILKIQLSAAKKRLSKLREIEAASGDTAKDIRLVEAEIEKLTASLKKIPIDRIREIGSHLKGWLNSLSGIGGELGESFSALADGVDSVTAAFDKDASTADHVSNGIAGLVKIYNMAANQLEENKRKQEEWNDRIEESVHKARMLRIEELEYNKANVFGVENPYAKAIAGANQYRQAMTELNASLGKLAGGQLQTGTKKVVSGKNIATGAAGGAAAGAAVGSVVPVVGTALGAAVGAVIGGIFGSTRKKVVPVFNSLAKEFGSILKNGTETFELNPAILANYSKLDDATKKLVDNWEEIRKKALEAQEQMRQTFSDLAGDIGNNLSEALVKSFRNNDLYSAVDEFEKKINGTIENIISQLVFSAHFQHLFDQLQQRMEDSFGTGGDGDIVDDIVWFSRIYKNQIAAYGKSMEEVREEMKRQGFDLFKPDEGMRTASAKAISGVTQESFDDFSGRLTFLVMKVTGLGTINTSILDANQEQLAVMYAMTGHLEVIAENSVFLRRLQEIDANIGKLIREGISIKR